MKMPLEEFVYIHENEEITLRDYLNGNMNIDYEGTAKWRIPFGGVDEPNRLPVYLSCKDLKEFERQYLEYSKRVTSHLIENINYIRAESV
jgi:hypothetical protein